MTRVVLHFIACMWLCTSIGASMAGEDVLAYLTLAVGFTILLGLAVWRD